MGWWEERRRRKRKQQQLVERALERLATGLAVYPVYREPQQEIPAEVDRALRELRQTMADVRVLCEILARAAETFIPDDGLPPDRLVARQERNGS